MQDRGKLNFSDLNDLSDIENNAELKSLIKQWKSFAETENEDRQKYLRELEIQFSMSSIFNGSNSEEIRDLIAKLFSDEKISQSDSSIINQLKDLTKSD